jgi:hypothetical protein
VHTQPDGVIIDDLRRAIHRTRLESAGRIITECRWIGKMAHRAAASGARDRQQRTVRCQRCLTSGADSQAVCGRMHGKEFSMGFRRRTRRRALVAGAVVGGAAAHHAANKQSEQQAYDEAPADQAPAEDYQEETQAVPPPADPADEIEHLAQLHASGALTDDEFAQAKAKVLGS